MKIASIVPQIRFAFGLLGFIAAGLFAVAPDAAGAESALPKETQAERDQRMGWFREARFGMFIHWGLYAVPAGEWNGKAYSWAGEWIMDGMRIPVSDYEKLSGRFNPVKFDAKQWVQAAKDAGMRYIVITSKHHDGFSMFDSAVSDYTITKATPFGRDPMKDLAAACAEAGITFCFYHSIMDWHHPDAQRIGEPNYNRAPSNPNFDRYVRDYLKPQLRELLTNYGPIGILWFDGEWIGDWTADRGEDLYAFCRSLQPDLIINNRVGKARGDGHGMDRGEGAVGDYGTPEQQIPANGFGPGVDWESCMTMNNTWGFRKDDHNWKSVETMIRMLIDCSSKGGNFLLNVGPTAEGEIPVESIQRLAEIGKWMRVNGESIYGTGAGPFRKLSFGKCTRKSGRLYLHVFDWPQDGQLLVPVGNRISRAYLLADRSQTLRVEKSDDGAVIRLPAAAPDPVASVVALEFEGEPQVIEKGIVQAGDGTLTLPADDADIVGIHARLENRGGQPNIGYWSATDDYVHWRARLRKPGEFEVELNYSCDSASDGNEFVVDVAGRKLRGKATATRSWDDFAVLKLGRVRLEKSELNSLTVTVTPLTIRGGGLMNLRSLVLKPVK